MTPEPALKVRSQALPNSLLDVFNYSQRADLDNWNTVSRQFRGTALSATPLRRVSHAYLHYDDDDTCVFIARFYYKAVGTGPNEDWTVLRKTDESASGISEVFFNGLRYCALDGKLDINLFPIDQSFVSRLKAISKTFQCDDRQIWLKNIPLSDDVNPFDVLVSFPSFHTLVINTLGFLTEHNVQVNDALLHTLATRGIWDADICYPKSQQNHITDEGILMFALDEFDSGGIGRRLQAQSPSPPLTPQFLKKLVKACCSSKSDHKLELFFCVDHLLEIDVVSARAQQDVVPCTGGPFDARLLWKLSFEDVPGLEAHYMPGYPSYRPCMREGRLHIWRNCTPTRAIGGRIGLLSYTLADP